MTDSIISIKTLQESIGSLPANDPRRPDLLHNLSAMYEARCEEFGDVKDLDESIKFMQEVVELTLNTDVKLFNRLHHLATVYFDRYKRTDSDDLYSSVEFLQKAIETAEIATGSAQRGHPHYANCLFNLGVFYMRRHEEAEKLALRQLFSPYNRRDYLSLQGRTFPIHFNAHETSRNKDWSIETRCSQNSDIERAIETMQEAAELLPIDATPSSVHFLELLGEAYDSKYDVTGQGEDLQAAIRLHEKVLHMTETDQNAFERASRLYHLASAYEERYEALGDDTDFDTMIGLYYESLNHQPSARHWRLRSGVKLLNILSNGGDWCQAYEVASTTASLVPLLVHHSQENSYKNKLLGPSRGLSSDAATAALMVGKPAFEAVRLNELGRGIIIGSILERSEFKSLQIRYPSVATALDRLRLPFHISPKLLGRTENLDNGETQIEQKVQEIRQLPGFDNFLMPLSEDDVKFAATHGPVVLLLAHQERCDAILIKEGGLTSLPLPNLRYEDISNMKTSEFNQEILERLWDTITGPILDALGFTEPPARDCWPHLWWIPTHPLVGLPIHAAGYHYHGSTETVIDRVVSSYSSSVKTLIQGRSTSSKQYKTHSMESSPQHAVLIGRQELPSAPKEVHDLEGICKEMKLKTLKIDQNCQSVLSALEDCYIFHFAGHGQANPVDPLKSSIILDDGALTVNQLVESKINEQRPFLAYLSACGTGQISHKRSSDESLHLISAFQLAGFQNVVGTLWQVEDEICPDIAIDTYRWIRDKNMSQKSVSEGLHHALRTLRGRWLSDRSKYERNKPPDTTLAGQVSEFTQQDGLRDTELCDDKKLPFWIPFVHYGS